MKIDAQISKLCRALQEETEGSSAYAEIQQKIRALQTEGAVRLEEILQERRDHYPGWEQTVQRAQDILAKS